MISLIVLLLLIPCIIGQDDTLCGARCDIDQHCNSGVCRTCLARALDGVRVCTAQSTCGGECRTASDCDAECSRCVDRQCHTLTPLQCGAACSTDLSCVSDCDACRADADASLNSTVAVCRSLCGATCTSDDQCGGRCSRCVDDKCVAAGTLYSAGEVAGIAIGGALGLATVAFLGGLACLYCTTDDDDDSGFAFAYGLMLFSVIAVICLIVGAIVIGLSLGLMPSTCCKT
jgi:hypothetical protein